jgi:FtsP/CotA-like multicopper oxidase with cupredoxin domain
VGDFHDTIQLGLESEAGDEMTVRFQTTTFKGDVMLHCHILAHEDSGMMAMVRVVGPSSEVVVFSQHPVCTLSNGYRC